MSENRRHGDGLLRTAAVIGVLVVGAVSACDDDPDAVRGSGTIVGEERSVTGFDEISVEGSGEVIVDVGGTESLIIEADDNLLPLIRSDVRGSTLVLDIDGSVSPSREIVYTVEAIDFEGVSIAGSVDVVAPNVDCASFRASVAGSGTFDLGGSCDALDVSIAGSATVDAADLTVASAGVDIAGSGSVVVNAVDQLRVSISGTGVVEYVGDPATDFDIVGAGDVRQITP
jgi:hypothetical protein